MISSAQIMPVAKSLSALVEGLIDPKYISPELEDLEVVDVSLDSRKLSDGAVFAAVPGTVTDGRKYISQALDNGACAVLSEITVDGSYAIPVDVPSKVIGISGLTSHLSIIAARLFDHPSRSMKLVGITGTNGKTTCASLLQQALDMLGERCAMMGTLGIEFEGESFHSGLTTADPVSVQRYLGILKERNASAATMEVSSHALDQHRVSAVDFNIAVFTNLSQDHLDYHQTMAAYGEAKKKLFEFSGLDAIVVNVDDVLGEEIAREFRAVPVITYGHNDADLKIVSKNFDSEGIDLDVLWKGQSIRFQSVLFGSINVPNLLAVAATLLAMGYSIREVTDVFPRMTPPPGRMERFTGSGSLPTVVVDYAHTPEALQLALQGLRPFCRGRLNVVFGCGGDRDRSKRPLMGQIAGQFADHVTVTNDNPRSEEPAAIVADIFPKGDQQKARIILDRYDAIRSAIQQSENDDIVLVAGKGHEQGQVIGDQTLPFSDRDVVKEIMELHR